MTSYTPRLLSASSIEDTKVVNAQGETLGDIEDLMIDVTDGRIEYAVLSFGGFLGMGDKLFALPWQTFAIDSENERFVLNVDKERLEDAPGFDKKDWPDFADPQFRTRIHNYYGIERQAA